MFTLCGPKGRALAHLSLTTASASRFGPGWWMWSAVARLPPRSHFVYLVSNGCGPYPGPNPS